MIFQVGQQRLILARGSVSYRQDPLSGVVSIGRTSPLPGRFLKAGFPLAGGSESLACGSVSYRLAPSPGLVPSPGSGLQAAPLSRVGSRQRSLSRVGSKASSPSPGFGLHAGPPLPGLGHWCVLEVQSSMADLLSALNDTCVSSTCRSVRPVLTSTDHWCQSMVGVSDA